MLPLESLCRKSEKLLRDAGIENASQEARWIVSAMTEISSAELTVSEKELTCAMENSILCAVARRAAHEPLQYILGNEFFGDYEFRVGKGVLIPRPETWKIVEFFSEKIPQNGSVCELGTGSGAVAVSLAHKRPDLKIFASELSPEAAFFARENIAFHKVCNVTLKEGSLFDPFSGMEFDGVAANLPYVAPEDRASLAPEVRDHEPELALFAGDHGMSVMKEAVRQLRDHLLPGGQSMFEMDPSQIREMKFFFSQNGFDAETVPDLFGKERFLWGRYCPKS